MTAPLTDAQLDEIEARAQLAYDGGDPLQTTGYDVPALLAGIRRLRGENEQLSDLDDAATRRAELQAERDRAVARWHEEHQRAEKAEAARNSIARQLADRTDELATTEAERARLATELGALDAERAALHVAQEDLQAAYDRLGEQAQRIVEAASRFRAERDRLHDALGDVLIGGWESNGAGDVRSPWIPAEEAAAWRRLREGTPRSLRDDEPIGETALTAPVALAAPSGPSEGAQAGFGRERGAVGRDGHTQADTEPARRAAIATALHEYADRLDAVPIDCTALTGPVWYGQGWRGAVNHLRDLADGLMPAPSTTGGSEP